MAAIDHRSKENNNKSNVVFEEKSVETQMLDGLLTQSNQKNHVETFEIYQYWQVSIAGMLGATTYISFPAFFSGNGEPGWLSKMVIEQGIANSSWFIFVFLLQLSVAAFFGGFIVLMSKQNKLWAAFIMGLSFPSILSSNIGGSNHDSSKEKSRVEESEVPNSPSIDIHGAISRWLEDDAYAQELVPSKSDDPNSNQAEAPEKNVKKVIELSAFADHKELLLKAFENDPDNLLAFSLQGDYLVKNVKIQIFYLNKSVTSFRILEENNWVVYVPKLSGIEKVKVFGKHVEDIEFSMKAESPRTLALIYRANFKKSMKNLVRRKGVDSEYFIPTTWKIEGQLSRVLRDK